MMKMTVDLVVEIKHTIFELFLLRVVTFVCFVSCISKKTVLSLAAYIQGLLLFAKIPYHFVRHFRLIVKSGECVLFLFFFSKISC